MEKNSNAKQPITIDMFIDPQTKAFNNSKLKKLSIEDFGKLHLLLMEEQKNYNGYWKNGNPKCFECNNDILSIDSMTKYYGTVLHPHCFIEKYLNDISRSKEDWIFYNRVAELCIMKMNPVKE